MSVGEMQAETPFLGVETLTKFGPETKVLLGEDSQTRSPPLPSCAGRQFRKNCRYSSFYFVRRSWKI